MSWVDEYSQQKKAVTPIHIESNVDRTKLINQNRKATEYDVFMSQRRERRPKDSKFRKKG